MLLSQLKQNIRSFQSVKKNGIKAEVEEVNGKLEVRIISIVLFSLSLSIVFLRSLRSNYFGIE